jgi:hypothetical protein
MERPDGTWLLLGDLARPEGEAIYPREYRVTLDDQGTLRIHAGAVPYRTVERAEELKTVPGGVLVCELEVLPRKAEENRDPFSGIH